MPRRGGGGHRRGSPHRRGGGGRPKRKGDASSNGSGASPSNSEKQEPLWMEGVHSEEDLQQRHINHIYHLAEEPCREAGHGADNCEDNPSCLLRLGERADGVWAKCPPTIEELGDDPHTQARQPDVPAGLENLGATCYMNNVLQCLFMNTAFRQGVFAWGATGDDRMLLESHQHDESKVSSVTDNENPPLAAAGEQHQQQGQQDKEEHGRDSVCLELQRLFALMQEGHRSFYTTKSLSQALNLKTSIQQDAQEFYKLFLDYLEERFNHSDDEAVKSLVLQFQGEYAYTTVCQACKTVSQRKCKFSELELNLKDAKTIDDSLQHFLAEEQLTEGNQYFCEQCNKLQDATRSIVLLDLPKVLNLQLMRFVYDLKTFHKKKLQDSIAFPLEIDMGQHMQDFDERSSSSLPSSSQPPCRQTEVENKRRRKGLTYELVGVLIHVGASANVGHYIAHIKDDVTKKWWRFDDAVVTPLEESKVGVEKETKKGGKKKSTLPEGMAESSNAYMLIYALKDRETIAQPRLPASATDVVLADNHEFEQQLKDYDVQVKEEQSRIAAHKEAYAAHFPSFAVKPDAKEYYWIATSWLRSWVTGAKELPPIDNTELLCAHDMLDPRKLAQAKRITPEAWTMLHAQYKGGPVLSQECYCMPCSAALCHELATEAEYNRMKEVTLNLISAGAASKGYILSTAWLNQWRKKNEPEDLSRNMNEKITCEHGNLSPAGGRRVIPPQAWSWLRSQFPEGAEFHSSESACKECIKDSANNKVELSNLKALKVKERQRANAIASEKTIQTGCKYYLISQEWFARWRSWIENAPDPEEPNPIANESLICRHERLHVPVGDDQFPLDVDETEFRLVKPELWTKLLKRKEVDYPIVLQTEAADATGRAYMLDPPVCPECTEERQHNKLDQQYNYSEAEIVVTTKRRAAAVGRARRSKGVKTDSITVSADDTILVVKLKILEKLEIEPNEQALFFGDVELKDSKATLRQFRVPAKATIHIERRQMSMADYDILDGHNQIEEGFKGTIFSHDRAETNHLPVSTPPPGSEGQSSAATEQQKLTTADTRVCAVCTFHNSGQHVVLCEMCEAPLT